MNLTPGRRLTAGERTAYVLGEPAWSTPHHTWMRARKVFWNFRYPGEPLYEAEADEWLDVLARVPERSGSDTKSRTAMPPGSAPGGTDFSRSRPSRESGPTEVGPTRTQSPAATARDPDEDSGLSRFERDSVLARADVPWFLELIDVLDHPDPAEDGPILVLSDPHAIPVVSESIDASRLVRMMTEVLAMLDHLHHEGMAASVLEPEDFLIDSTGRWFFLGTDRIEPATASDPSVFSNDLTAWARCVERLLGATDRGPIESAWPFLGTLPEPARPPARWLFDRVRRCLDPDPARRPTSLDDLAHGRTAGLGALGSLWNLLGRRPSCS